MGWVFRLWGCRWNAARLACAVFLAWVFAADTGARLARLQMAALPDFDYIAEVRSLRAEGRYGEAVTIADAGLDVLKGEQARELLIEKERALAEQDSVVRMLKDAGKGALSGRATSLEGLVGALAADFFVVGDVRDVVIEGGKFALDGESDEVVLALSVVGLVTTLAPQVDWVPSLLKLARRIGTLSEGLARFITRGVRTQNGEDLRGLFKSVAEMSEASTPGAAVRLLKHADSPADAAVLAGYLKRQQRGAFALHVTGGEGAALVKRAAAGSTGLSAEATELLVLKAARKGASGRLYIAGGAARALLRPHPLVGLAKGLWKGNVPDALTRAVDRMAAKLDIAVWWILPLVAAWGFLEACGLWVKLARPAAAEVSRRDS